MPVVKTFGDLRKLPIRLNHNDGVQVTKAGSHYRARFRGRANNVFGTTPEDAKQRLRSAQSKRWGIAPAPISKFEKQLLEACR